VLKIYITIVLFVSSDAQRVLQHGTLTLEDANLRVSEMTLDDDTKEEEECGPPSSCGHILEIRGIKPDSSEDIVEMYIENMSGGTELQSFVYNKKTGVAVVGFKNPEGCMITNYLFMYLLD